MPGLTWSRAISALAVSVVLICLSPRADAQIRFDLRAQPLAVALTTVGNLANMNVLFDSTLVDGLQAPPLKAELSADDALIRLLAGTRLCVVRVNENTVSVLTEADAKRAERARDPNTSDVHEFGSVRLAYVGTDAERGGGGSVAQRSDESSSPKRSGEGRERNDLQEEGSKKYKLGDIEEVVVSAQKRTERLQDVPVPVTAISAQVLVDSNQLRLQDYYTSVPGLSVPPASNQSAQFISIRGITTGGGNPSVGIVVDDVPFGASTGSGGGQVVPDVDPSDLSRVEVLRGPQGTLYGASSMGGLLKFVTVDASTDSLNGRAEAGLSGVKNGDTLGYNVRGSVNVPLGDTFAVRASGFTRHDPGYIDNPVRNVNGINSERVSGGRLSGLWHASDTLSLRLSALYQDTKSDGNNDVDRQPGLGDLQQNYLAGIGGFDRKVQAYSATLDAALGGAKLTSVSGYNINEFSDSFDYTYALGPVTLGQFGVTGTPLVEHNRTGKFSQEVRLSAPLGQRADWLIGAFYTDERSQWVQDIYAQDPVTGARVGQWVDLSFPTTYREYAAFSDLTFHLTERFDVQLGGRESWIHQTYLSTYVGPYTQRFLRKPSPYIQPEADSDASAFTYLVTPRFKVSSDLMLYTRLASGYRAGGPNIGSGETGAPAEYNPDKTQDYEIGVKGDFFNHALSIDTSAYYIDWKDIQINVIDARGSYRTNGSRARSKGVELSAQAKPLTGLTVGAWVVWSKAVLTENLPPTSTVFGASGNELPYSSRFSGNLSVEQSFLITSNVTGFVGGTVSYVGDRQGVFRGLSAGVPLPRQDYPSYAKTDLRTGVRYGTWSANLYVNNLTDRRGVLNGGLGQVPPFAFIYIQPRVVGLSLSTTF